MGVENILAYPRSKVEPRSHYHVAHLHLPTNAPTKYQLPVHFPTYNPDKGLKFKLTMARSKVKSRSHHNVAHLHLPTNVPTKCEVLISHFSETQSRLGIFSGHPPALAPNRPPAPRPAKCHG